jgi:hypothetical protein
LCHTNGATVSQALACLLLAAQVAASDEVEGAQGVRRALQAHDAVAHSLNVLLYLRSILKRLLSAEVAGAAMRIVF